VAIAAIGDGHAEISRAETSISQGALSEDHRSVSQLVGGRFTTRRPGRFQEGLLQCGHGPMPCHVVESCRDPTQRPYVGCELQVGQQPVRLQVVRRGIAPHPHAVGTEVHGDDIAPRGIHDIIQPFARAEQHLSGA